MDVENYGSDFEGIGNDEDIYFKPFEKTFNYVMFCMAVGMIYPNPKTEKWRIAAIFFYMLIISPATSFIAYDMVEAYKEGDMDSIFRHTIVMGPFLSQYLKMVLMYKYRTNAKLLLEEMNEYFEKLNSKPLSHKFIAKKWLTKSFFLEKSWAYCVLAGSFSFPISAICKNIYSALFDEYPRRYCIQEVRSPFGGSNLDFPFYEIMFINTCMASCMYYINFNGYDGFFVQLILHTALRIAVCSESLKDAFKIDDSVLRRKAVGVVIKEHIAICNFMSRVNVLFEQWMSTITSAMVIHLCSCVFFLSKRNGIQDAQFLFSFFAAFMYLFMICFVGGLLQYESEKLSDLFYQCGWENTSDPHCRRLLVFMIARAQKPLQVTTIAMYKVNLQLFVRVLKMAYSLLTFLQQT
ncbi:hypothetical protein ABMA28_010556 [Loxostege sticticalis]|uniref:Odorant receptor n=1 Tax=Loxostege sticticalis TaxID=481309 RepID=A0ABD0S8M6_LOXSC